MATRREIKALEKRMVETADALVLAVITHSVKHGINELNNFAGVCAAAINAWKNASGISPG